MKYGAPISKLAVLNNLSVLVAIVLGFLVFAEGKELNLPKFLGGTILILAGTYLVMRS